jgi:hypothetical protein
MKRNSTPVMIASNLVALAGLGIGCADATDYHWDPMVMLSGNYNDNYGLDSGNAQNVSVEGAIVDAALHLSIINPDAHFEITPKVHSVYYPGQSQFDANNVYVDSQFEQLWPRGNFYLNEMFWSQDVLTSYLPTTAIGVPLGQNNPGADLALVNERIRQDLLLLAPIANFDLSPRKHLEIRAQYLSVDYSQAINNQIQNFKSYSGSLGLGFDITPQSTITVRGIASDLRPVTGSGANTYGAEGEWQTHLSEVMQAYAKFGLEHTSFNEAQYGQSSATSVSGGIGISRKFVAYDLFVDFARSVSPDAFGTVVVRNDLRARLEHKFSGRTSGYVGFRGINQTALGNSGGFVGQRYGQAALGAEWRIYRQFSIISEYAYTTFKQYVGGAQAAGSNAVTISLRYEPHRPAEELGVNFGQYQ